MTRVPRAVRSRTDLVAHVVWTVKRRAPTLVVAQDGWLRDALWRKVDSLQAELCAFGASFDHVHVVLRYPGDLALSDLVGQMKGYSSFLWNRATPPRDPLDWQDGYWAESCGPSHLDELLGYVGRQRERHTSTTEREHWEEAWDKTL